MAFDRGWNHLMGGGLTRRLGIGGAHVFNWLPVTLQTLTINDNAWTNFTLRQPIAAAFGGLTAGNYIRVGFSSSTIEGLSVGKAYVGILSGSNGFASAPTALTFNTGSAGFALAANQSIMSDTVPFVLAGGQGICISVFFPSGHSGDDAPRRRNTPSPSPGTSVFKAGDDAITQSPSGYSNVAGNAFFLEDLETST